MDTFGIEEDANGFFVSAINTRLTPACLSEEEVRHAIERLNVDLASIQRQMMSRVKRRNTIAEIRAHNA